MHLFRGQKSSSCPCPGSFSLQILDQYNFREMPSNRRLRHHKRRNKPDGFGRQKMEQDYAIKKEQNELKEQYLRKRSK